MKDSGQLANRSKLSQYGKHIHWLLSHRKTTSVIARFYTEYAWIQRKQIKFRKE